MSCSPRVPCATRRRPMEHDDVVGGPALDRQERPVLRDARGQPLVPQRVPEVRPTPLTDWFIYLSVVVLAAA